MEQVKITELKEKRFRTVTKKDALGNRIRTKEEYTALREVRTIGSGPRFGHFIIDTICFRILIMCFQFAIGFVYASSVDFQVVGATILLITQIGLVLLYPMMYFICEVAWQRTPGKFLTKCVVIDEYAEKPDVRTIALRSLLRLVPFEAFSCLGGQHSRGWHDKWSNTWVVTQEERDLLKSLLAVQSMS